MINKTDFQKLSESEATTAYIAFRQLNYLALGLPNMIYASVIEKLSLKDTVSASVSVKGVEAIASVGEIYVSSAARVDIPSDITALAEKRWAAKQAKDFAGADALRKELSLSSGCRFA